MVKVRRSEPVCVAVKGAEVEDCQQEGKLVGSGASARIDDFQQTFGESGPGGCRYPVIMGHGSLWPTLEAWDSHSVVASNRGI